MTYRFFFKELYAGYSNFDPLMMQKVLQRSHRASGLSLWGRGMILAKFLEHGGHVAPRREHGLGKQAAWVGSPLLTGSLF